MKNKAIDKMMFVLYIMIMNYFNGIEWVGYNHMLGCRAKVKKYFRDYFVLDYNHHGELNLELDDDPVIKLSSPVAWFTFPGPFFSFAPVKNTSWDHRHIGFRGDRVKRWIESGLVNFNTRSPVVPVIDSERFSRQMDEVIKYISSPIYGQERAVQMFEGLLLQLHEQCIVQPAISPTDNKVSILIDEISLTPEAVWDFKRKARLLGISYSHFRLIFRNLSGLPPHQYINRQRMEKAARLLRENQLEIKEIANLVGYDDIFHFSKLFKKHFQIPPGYFRSQSILKK